MNKTVCRHCHALILETTAAACGGSCMPCFMDANAGWRPEQVRGIRERGDQDLDAAWQRHRALRYPPVGTTTVADACLPMLDSDASTLVAGYLGSGSLEPDDLQRLEDCRDDLLRVCSELSDEAAAYFDALRRLCDDVLQRFDLSTLRALPRPLNLAVEIIEQIEDEPRGRSLAWLCAFAASYGSDPLRSIDTIRRTGHLAFVDERGHPLPAWQCEAIVRTRQHDGVRVVATDEGSAWVHGGP